MKTTNAAIWELVRSMTRNEKIFFKNEGAEERNGKPLLYIRLFDCIAELKSYDEDVILKKLGPDINKKNLAYQKHYLYSLLNDSLVRYDNRNNPEQLIYKNIQLIRIKRKKGLLDEALLLWKKTMQKAREVELFSMSQLLKKEFERMIMFSSVQIRYEELHNVFRSNKLTYDDYAEMITLRDIYAHIVMLRRKAHFDFDESVKKELKALMKEVKGKKAGLKSPSFWHRHYTRMCLATLHFLSGEIKDAMPLIKDGVEDWWKHPHFIESDTEHYIELLYLVNYAGIIDGDFNYVERVFNNEANSRIKEEMVHAGFESLKYLALNKIYNKTARYHDVKKLVEQMKVRYITWEPLLNAELNRTICFSLGIAFFVLDNYTESLQFIRRGVTYFRDGTREEQLVFAHLFLLLIHYMMGNQRLFEAQHKSTYSYLYKKKKLDHFVKVLMNCLYDSFYLQSQKEKSELFQKTIADLDKNKNEMQSSILNIFNFHGWLKSRVQKISYKEFVSRKYNEEMTKKTSAFTPAGL